MAEQEKVVKSIFASKNLGDEGIRAESEEPKHVHLDGPAKFIKNDVGKPNLSMLFDIPFAMVKLVEIMEHGIIEHGRKNHQHMDDKERYVSAALRHIMKYLNGEYIDKDSGKPHLACAASDILFVLDLDEKEKGATL